METAQKFFERMFFPEYDSFRKGICIKCEKEKAVYKPLSLCIDDLRAGYYSGGEIEIGKRKIKISKRKFESIESQYRAWLSRPPSYSFIILLFEKKLFLNLIFLFAFLEITFFVKDKTDYFLDNCLN